MYLLRRKILKKEVPKEWFFVLFSGLLSYIFLERPENLKYANIFKGLWGEI